MGGKGIGKNMSRKNLECRKRREETCWRGLMKRLATQKKLNKGGIREGDEVDGTYAAAQES